MSIKFINVGSSANDNTGSTIRAGGQLLNNNFATLISHLSTTGTSITLNTASTPSNTYLGSTFVSNAYAISTYTTNTVVFSTFAQNTATMSAVSDRMQVANVNTLTSSSTVQTRAALANTNSAIADRTQVSNTFSVLYSGKSYSTVPNYGAAVTYDISANGSNGYLITNMQYDAIGNNPAITVRNESTVAFDLNGLGGAHPFAIKSAAGDFSNTLIHVATDGTVSTGSSAQGKTSGVLYWQIPHNITGSGNAYRYQCNSHAGMKGNVVIKDTGAI